MVAARLSTRTKMDKETITTVSVGLVGASLLLGSLALQPDASVQKEPETLPPIGMVVDMPDSDVGNLKSRLSLLTAGGAYDRDIYVVVTDTTHPDNLKALREFPHVTKISTTSAKTKNEKDVAMRAQLGTPEGKFIYAKP